MSDQTNQFGNVLPTFEQNIHGMIVFRGMVAGKRRLFLGATTDDLFRMIASELPLDGGRCPVCRAADHSTQWCVACSNQRHASSAPKRRNRPQLVAQEPAPEGANA